MNTFISNPITLELEAKDQELKSNHTNIASLRLDKDLFSIHTYIHSVSEGYNAGFMTETAQQPYRWNSSLQDFSQQILTWVIMKIPAKLVYYSSRLHFIVRLDELVLTIK